MTSKKPNATSQGYKTSLVLMVLLLGLGGWYFLYEKKYRVQQKETEEKGKQIVLLDKDAIQEIEIDRATNAPPEAEPVPAGFKANYEKISLRRAGGDWNLLTPLQDLADTSVVTGIVTALTTTKQERVVDEKPKDLEPYGLKEPLFIVRVKKEAGSKPEEVFIGSNTPVGANTYVKVGSGEAVYKVPSSLRTAVNKDVKALRNKGLFPQVVRSEIVEVEIKGPKEAPLFKKDADKEQWSLSREGIPADGNEWTKTLNAILDLKGTDFPDQTKKPAAYGLAPPLYKISLTRSTNNEHLGLLVGKTKEGKFFVKREDKDTIYEITKEFLDKLERPTSAYWNRALSHFNRYELSRIRFERAQDPLELVRAQPEGWGIKGDEKAPIDPVKIDDLVTRFQDVKIQSFLPEKAAKLTPAKTALTVRLSEGKADKEKEKVVLRFSKPVAKKVTAEREGLAVGFVISEDDFKKINVAKQAVLKDEKAKSNEPQKAVADPAKGEGAHDGHDHETGKGE